MAQVTNILYLDKNVDTQLIPFKAFLLKLPKIMSIQFTLDDFPDWLPFLPWRIVFVRYKSKMFNSYGKNDFLDIRKNVVFDTIIWGNKETEVLYTKTKSQNPLGTMSFSTR